MIEEAKDLSKTKQEITEDSIIGVFTGRRKTAKSTAKQIFMQSILATLGMNNHKEDARKIWPNNWPDMSFGDLAKFILPLLIFLISFLPAQSQLQVTIGAGKTDLKNDALLVGVSYLRSLDSLWQTRNNFIQGKNSFTSFYPEVDIKTGTADAFSSLNLRVKGLTMVYKNKRIATVSRLGKKEDIIAPDLSKTINTFFFSGGVESNNRFDNVNGIVEAGWAPWFQQANALDNVEFALSLQAGYKFSRNTDSLKGGEVPETLEQAKRGIFRVHGELGGSVDSLISWSLFKIGVEGHFESWYDVVNKVFYKAGTGTVKFYISPNTTVLGGFQFGSYAPLFNDAKQFFVGGRFVF